MFLTHAHSFKQQARLAITLAWVAGYTNIVALLACGTVTSHMTGAASNLGRGLVEQNWPLARLELFLLGSFVCGAVLAEIAMELGRQRRWESLYVLPMALQALLLAVFAIGIERLMAHHAPGGAAEVSASGPLAASSTVYGLVGCAASAMGLQNATITRISSGAVRTTHLTGVMTDIGTELVASVRAASALVRGQMRAAVRSGETADRRGLITRLDDVRRDASVRRLALLTSIAGSFVLGAGLGTLIFERVATQWAMFPPVLFLLWIIAQDLRTPIAEIRPSPLIAMTRLDLPSWLAVFQLGAPDSSARVQRLPDLLDWVDTVPQRVIVLDLTNVGGLDEDAGLQLRAALVALHGKGRSLILAGIDAAQCAQLRRAGAGNVLDANSVCPDLELAIARGLSMAPP